MNSVFRCELPQKMDFNNNNHQKFCLQIQGNMSSFDKGTI